MRTNDTPIMEPKNFSAETIVAQPPRFDDDSDLEKLSLTSGKIRYAVMSPRPPETVEDLRERIKSTEESNLLPSNEQSVERKNAILPVLTIRNRLADEFAEWLKPGMREIDGSMSMLLHGYQRLRSLSVTRSGARALTQPRQTDGYGWLFEAFNELTRICHEHGIDLEEHEQRLKFRSVTAENERQLDEIVLAAEKFGGRHPKDTSLGVCVSEGTGRFKKHLGLHNTQKRPFVIFIYDGAKLDRLTREEEATNVMFQAGYGVKPKPGLTFRDTLLGVIKCSFDSDKPYYTGPNWNVEFAVDMPEYFPMEVELNPGEKIVVRVEGNFHQFDRVGFAILNNAGEEVRFINVPFLPQEDPILLMKQLERQMDSMLRISWAIPHQQSSQENQAIHQ